MRKWFKALVISFTAAAAVTLIAATVSAANVGSWGAAGGTMVKARQGASASLLPDGKVLVAGGETTGPVYETSVEIYTPTGAGSWSDPSKPMTNGRAYHSARVLPNGKVMVMGGYNGSAMASTEIYDPTTQVWAAGSSMSTARYKFATAILLNGKIMVIGGYDGTNTVTNKTEIYDPTTNTWSAGPNLNTSREGASASTLKDGRVVVFGGYNGTTTLNTAEIYSPGLGAWASVGPTMTSARRNATSVNLADGTILIAGGYDGTTILNTTEIFNPTINVFTADANVSQASGRRYPAITQIQDGKVLLIGGNNGSYLNTAEIGTFPATSKQSTIPVLSDVGNAGNASDMMVTFKGAPIETFISGYRVYVTDTTIASGADAAAITNTAWYVSDTVKGAGKMHLIKLPASLKKADGNNVDATTGSYKVYVLAKGKPGYGDTLSTVSVATPFAISASVNGVTQKLATPVVVDYANNVANHELDFRITFKRPFDESRFAATNTYRMYIVPDATSDATFRASSWFTNANYATFDKVLPSVRQVSYIKTPTSGTKDSNGIAIAEGTAYRVYIVAVGSDTVNGKDAILSPSSRPITLSKYVPGVYSVRSVTVSKTGTGFTSDLIKVNFQEPSVVTDIQDYRIFLVNSTATLTQAVADTNATVAGNCYTYTPDVTTRLKYRPVQLTTGIKAYDGTTFNTLVTKGVYKVYVLSYTASGKGNKLSLSSVGSITLD